METAWKTRLIRVGSAWVPRQIRIRSALELLDRSSVDRLPAKGRRSSPRAEGRARGAPVGREGADMDELELQHAEAHYAELSRDGYSGRCEMFLPEDLRGMRVLDLGCRNGKGACKLADRVGPDGFVLGIDPSAACVARAEATAAAARAEGAAWAGRLAFARGCFEGLRAAGVEDASFDVVIVNSVLNLAWDLKEALRETARAIAPGGRYFCGLFDWSG